MLSTKYKSELSFWLNRYICEHKKFQNSHYKKIFLSMMEEENDNFVFKKRIADFGCGPRGSLAWANNAELRVGIDVLSDAYADLFPDNIINHNMIYVKSTEKHIPTPSNYFDIVFTLNAMDHVDNLESMSSEIYRIMKIGGFFVGSFNLNEPASACEPQTLTEEIVRERIIKEMKVISWRTAQKNEKNTYQNFFDNKFGYRIGTAGILWVKAKKA